MQGKKDDTKNFGKNCMVRKDYKKTMFSVFTERRILGLIY